MTPLASKLALAALVATAAPAWADGDGCDRGAPQRTYPAAPYGQPADPWGWDDWGHRGDRGERPGRRPAWRERERAELLAEFRALDEMRADFHARFGWNRRRVWKFERWYAARWAELERRWWALDQLAWR